MTCADNDNRKNVVLFEPRKSSEPEDPYVNPDTVLDKAKGMLQDAVVIGWDKEGYLFLASSSPDICEVNLLIDKGKQAFLGMVDEIVEESRGNPDDAA